jgi:hypothetical protein
MSAAAVIVMLAEADFVLSLTEVTVTVTVLLAGMFAGASYVVAMPLGVEVGLKLPQLLLPHVTVHFTPAPLLSLLTFAVMAVVVLAVSDAGGCAEKETAIGGGVGSLPPPPQEASDMVKTATAANRMVFKNFTVHLPCVPCVLDMYPRP